MGLSFSSATMAFYKQVIDKNKIPFETTNSFSKSHIDEIDELKKRISDVNEGYNLISKTTDELKAYENNQLSL